jgi:NADPH:quinone reductase-like Zn-dependent oxidoreductase
MGADHVLTYNELADKTLHSRIKEITGDRPIRLFLNCVGGRDTTLMAKLLGKDGHMVSYGGMSKQPISLPVSLHIFNNLTSHGFWQACWYETHSRSEREKLVDRLITLIAENQVGWASCRLEFHNVNDDSYSYMWQMPR